MHRTISQHRELFCSSFKIFISQVREKDKAKIRQEGLEKPGEGMKKENSSFKDENFQVRLVLMDAPCGCGKCRHVANHKNIMGVKLEM